MWGWIISGIVGLVLLRKAQAQNPLLTASNPQPIPAKPATVTVSPAIAAVQPQAEMSKIAIVTAQIPYKPATVIPPELGAGENQAQSLAPVNEHTPVQSLDNFPARDNQVTSATMELGLDGLSEAIL